MHSVPDRLLKRLKLAAGVTCFLSTFREEFQGFHLPGLPLEDPGYQGLRFIQGTDLDQEISQGDHQVEKFRVSTGDQTETGKDKAFSSRNKTIEP